MTVAARGFSATPVAVVLAMLGIVSTAGTAQRFEAAAAVRHTPTTALATSYDTAPDSSEATRVANQAKTAARASPNGSSIRPAGIARCLNRIFVAAETAGNAGDHIVLRLRANGLDATAAKVGGRTLLKDAEWRATLQRGVADLSTKYMVSLDDMSGRAVRAQVMGAAQRGAAQSGGHTCY